MAGYGDDQGFTDWLAENGHTLPDDAPSSAVLRQRGSVYLDGLYGSPLAERRFSGVPTGGVAQDRAWPRTGAKAFGTLIADDLIPPAIINASYAAALYEAQKPGALAIAASQSGALKRKKIEGLEKEYFEGTGDVVSDGTVRLSSVEGLLAPYLVPGSVDGPSVWSIG